MTPLPLEQLLKRLPEVDPEHFQATECADEIAWHPECRDGYALWFWEDGEVKGGDALWFMFQTMREAYLALPKDLNAQSEVERRVEEVLSDFFGSPPLSWTGELILSTYVAWKEVLVKVGGAS
jgi:hypothetical protein